MKFVTISLTFLVLCFSLVTFAQRSSIKVIAEVPLHFGIGYEGQVSKHFSVGSSVGVLTKPNSDLILRYMRFVGTDELVVLILEDAFQLGIVGELNLNYNLGLNYFGVFGQVIGVKAGDASIAVVEDYFNTTMNDYPFRSGKAGTSEKYLTVRTRLYQAGILYGRRFPLGNDRFEIDIEFGLSGNVGSTSSITSEVRDLTELNKRANTALDEFYKDYAFIPSFAVMFVYKFKRDSQN